jgi:hypothetical protein
MGAKTGLLVYSDGDAADALRHAVALDARGTADLVALIYPGWQVVPAEGSSLGEGTYPRDGVSYMASLDSGVDVVCDQRLMDYRPSRLPEHLVRASAGRRMVLHAMHSVVDALTFAVWEDGELVRSLSVSPDSGVVENIGSPYDFEVPYWAGAHPVEPWPDGDDPEPYPLPFHPLELGEEALRALVGFVLEGHAHPDDVDPYALLMNGYLLTDPDGPDPAEERAAMERAVRAMRLRRSVRFNTDGTVTKLELP